MAARDLCDELIGCYEKKFIDDTNEKFVDDIYSVYLKHLESPYKEIQGNLLDFINMTGNAIRCLSRCMPYIQKK